MSDFSYLKQLAARTSGHLPILRPPRSPFPQLGTMQLIESRSSSEMPITSFAPTPTAIAIAPNMPMVEKTRKLSPQPPIELPETAIAPNMPMVEKTRKLSPQPPELKTVLPSSTVTFQNSTKLNSLPAFEEIRSSASSLGSAEVMAAQENSSFVATAQPQFNSEEIELAPISHAKGEEITINQRPSPQPKIEQKAPLELLSPRHQWDDESKEIKSDHLPILSPRVNNNFPPNDETPDMPNTSCLPVKSPQDLSSSNKIHIGAINIQITPSAPPPPTVLPVAKPAIKSTSTASLSRGFTSVFGLKQE